MHLYKRFWIIIFIVMNANLSALAQSRERQDKLAEIHSFLDSIQSKQ